jgi:hypothetical protein
MVDDSAIKYFELLAGKVRDFDEEEFVCKNRSIIPGNCECFWVLSRVGGVLV